MKEVEKYLFSLEKKGIILGPERTSALLDICGKPHQKLKILQVLGTNGKGSTSAILFKILQLNGMSVGLYTSPHLKSFKERIRVNGKTISDKHVHEFINTYKKDIDRLEASFFEVLTVMSVWVFKKLKLDYVILETGLGGRLDSVTSCKAQSFAITSISMDHNHILGETLEKIAVEKISAISKKSKVYISDQNNHINDLIKRECVNKQCKYSFVKTNSKLDVSLKGEHQMQNASLAVEIAKDMGCRNTIINKALKKVKWYGRNQVISKSPDIIFDVAHNEEGVTSFLKYLNTLNKKYDRKYLLLSLQNKKNIKKCIPIIEKEFDKIIYSKTDQLKSMDFDVIKRVFKKEVLFKKPKEAIGFALNISNKKDLIAIIGTHYWGNDISDIFNIYFDII
ncbi:MAG: hypothetical protein CMG00_09340 [Candidatus Marinimicrobia bacterium]|nr:hypothetical protein [Candidatus Neomarinimicrobiota bacterium]|tara:strand:+ start:12748 stop:13932 length:1185 start_codon:yes stop_codon:yes gene_type:complete